MKPLKMERYKVTMDARIIFTIVAGSPEIAEAYAKSLHNKEIGFGHPSTGTGKIVLTEYNPSGDMIEREGR